MPDPIVTIGNMMSDDGGSTGTSSSSSSYVLNPDVYNKALNNDRLNEAKSEIQRYRSMMESATVTPEEVENEYRLLNEREYQASLDKLNGIFLASAGVQAGNQMILDANTEHSSLSRLKAMLKANPLRYAAVRTIESLEKIAPLMQGSSYLVSMVDNGAQNATSLMLTDAANAFNYKQSDNSQFISP